MINDIMVIVLLNFLVYARTLRFGYVSDDLVVSWKTEPKPRHFIHGLWLQFWGHRYINTQHAHFMTLCLHTLNCVLVYVLLRNSPIALITALFFSVNPVNMQGGAVWLSGRGYSFATTATLIMFLVPFLAPILYWCAPYISPSAFFTPAGFLGTKWWFWLFLIPVYMKWGAMGKIVNNKIYNHQNKTVNTEMLAIKPSKLIVFTKSFGYYFNLCLFPFKIGLYHKFLYGFGTNKTDNKKGYALNKDFWCGIITILSILFHVYSYHNLASWGLVWFSVNIAMWCNIRTIQQQISERYCYLANVGMMVFLAYSIKDFPLVCVGIFSAYLTRLWFIMPSYISDYWIIEYNIHEEKKLHYPWLMRGVKKFGMGDFKGAFHDWCEAHQHKPYDFKVLYNLSCVSLLMGDFKNARKFFDEAIKFKYDEIDDDINPLFNALEGEVKKAEEQAVTGKYQVDLNKIRVVK